MNRLLEKLIAIMLVFVLISANLVVLGEFTIANAASDEELNGQRTSTNNRNVEFNSYLEGNAHIQTFDIGDENAKIYLNIKVENEGYIKDATVEFSNVNFKIKSDIQNDNIQNIDAENNRITLNKIDNGSDVVIELPIEILNNETISNDYFNKEFVTKLTGTYVNSNGRESSVEKEITNRLSWKGTAEAELKSETTKYIPYQNDAGSGVMLQTKITSNVKESSLPVRTTSIQVVVPTINNTKPTSVSVIALKTEATNGKTDGLDFTNNNYTYDAENGNVTIYSENTGDNVAWKKNVADEYLVTYLFEGEEFYNEVSTNGINTVVTANSTLTLYNNEETVANAQATSEIVYNNEDKVGEISDFEVVAPEEINKGNVYANYDAETKLETEYYTKYIATISSTKLTNTITFNQSYDQFVTSEDATGSTTVSGNNYAYNKKVQISQAIFQKILGEEGTIIISDEDGKELGRINKDTPVENGIYVLDISSADNNKLVITTSAPITEGQLEIEVIKAIKGNIDYSKDQMENFDTMRAELTGTTNIMTMSDNTETTLKEPVTTAEVTIEPQNLSTVITNEDVEIRAILNTSDEIYALYKNPVIEIVMPEEVTNINLKSVNLLLEDELKITSSEVVEENGRFVIRIVLEGTQTKYINSVEENNITKGANIVIKADITLDKFTSNKTENIQMYYYNENSNLYAKAVTSNSETIGEASTPVTFVAPSGVNATHTMTGYDDEGSSIVNISDGKEEATIAVHGPSRELTIGGSIINNYSNEISNVVILGRLPVKDNKNVDTGEALGSTFDAPLSGAIQVSGTEGATIYYSENVDATNDLGLQTNGWTTSPSNWANVKSYMIVLANNMAASARVDFTYNATLPADLAYGNSTYEMYKVFYTNNATEATINETKISSIIGLTTGQGPELQIEMTSNVKQENGVNAIRQGSQVRVWVNVKNNGKIDATNVKLTVNKPEEINLLQYDSSVSGYPILESNVIEVGNIPAGETTTVEFELQLQQFYNIAEGNQQGTVKAVLSADNMSYNVESNELTMQYLEGLFTIRNKPSLNENLIYTTNSPVEYEILVANISSDITNFTLTVPLPTDVQEVDAYWKTAEGEDKEGIQISTNAITATKATLEAGNSTLIVTFKIGPNTETRFSTQVTAEATFLSESTGTYYSNERFINRGIPALSGTQLTPQLKIEQSDGSYTYEDTEYVSEGAEFDYVFEVKTSGSAENYNFTLQDTLPEGLEYVTYNVRIEHEDGLTYNEQISVTCENNVVTARINRLRSEATVTIRITVRGYLESEAEDGKAFTNTATISSDQVSATTLNARTIYLEYDPNANNPNNPSDPNDPNNPSTGERNRITGRAWVDSNQDGRRDDGEELLAGVQVILLNEADNSIATNSSTGENQITTTGSDGRYSFSNVANGEYIVVFVYDSGLYSITTYQASGIDDTNNSDAISMRITLNGEQKEAGVTDILRISNDSLRNIDIGLYVSEKFDLRLDKYISKVTLTTPTVGTQATEYDNSKLQRVEVLGRNVNQSSVVVEYKIVVTNEGRIAGYARKLIDYLPDFARFNSELNPDWYMSDTTGNVYNASLANEKIEPGESKEVTLILSMQITDENIGKTLTNTAEIYESYNEQGTPDMDSTAGNGQNTEDDRSEAEIVLSIVTGNAIILYVSIALVVIAILGVGIYEIKKRVLNKK